jgi:putative ABC transport system substrate-binding protein
MNIIDQTRIRKTGDKKCNSLHSTKDIPPTSDSLGKCILLLVRKFWSGWPNFFSKIIMDARITAPLNVMIKSLSQKTREWHHAFVMIILFSFLTVVLSLNPVSAYAVNKVAIISIDEEFSTIRTGKGIKKSLNRSGIQIEYQESTLSGHSENDARTVQLLREFDPQLFITIGSYATLKMSEAFPNKPIIFATVMNPIASGFIASIQRPGGNITGAALDIPPDMQFKYFKRVVGDIKTMGVLYSSETENIIKQARVAAKQLGIELIARKVASEKEIPEAIDSLCQKSDALWSVADHNVYTPHSTKYIILHTLRNSVPMMGFSQALVEAGGLFTLDFDFKDIGRQAGDIAVRVLKGKRPGDIAVTAPGVIYFKYNEKTANKINLKIPEDLLAIAKEVVK